jgi:RNA polymerase subunit RPABC4/transcription elongation factor Spt4
MIQDRLSCPNCGSYEVVPILYGLVVSFTAEDAAK